MFLNIKGKKDHTTKVNNSVAQNTKETSTESPSLQTAIGSQTYHALPACVYKICCLLLLYNFMCLHNFYEMHTPCAYIKA